MRYFPTKDSMHELHLQRKYIHLKMRGKLFEDDFQFVKVSNQYYSIFFIVTDLWYMFLYRLPVETSDIK